MILLKHAPVLLITIPLLAAFATPLIGKINSFLRDFCIMLALISTEV